MVDIFDKDKSNVLGENSDEKEVLPVRASGLRKGLQRYSERAGKPPTTRDYLDAVTGITKHTAEVKRRKSDYEEKESVANRLLQRGRNNNAAAKERDAALKALEIERGYLYGAIASQQDEEATQRALGHKNLIGDLRSGTRGGVLEAEIGSMARIAGRDAQTRYTAEKISPFKLQRQYQSQLNMARGYEEEVRTGVETGIYSKKALADNPALAHQINDLVHKRDAMAAQAASTEAAIAYQHKTGRDEMGMQERGGKIAERYEKFKSSQGISASVEQMMGGRADTEKMSKLYSDAAKEAADGLKALAEATRSGSGDIEGLAKAADKAMRETENYGKVLDEMKRQGKFGGGGGGGGGFLGISGKDWGAALASAGMSVAQGFTATAAANRYRDVTVPIVKQELGAGYANLINQRYAEEKAAALGDMGAYLRIAKYNELEVSKNLGGHIARKELEAVREEVKGKEAGGIAGVASTGFAVAGDVLSGHWGDALKKMTGAPGEAIQSKMQIEMARRNEMEQISAREADLAQQQAFQAKLRAMTELSGQQMNTYMDYKGQLAVGMRGVGLGDFTTSPGAGPIQPAQGGGGAQLSPMMRGKVQIKGKFGDPREGHSHKGYDYTSDDPNSYAGFSGQIALKRSDTGGNQVDIIGQPGTPWEGKTLQYMHLKNFGDLKPGQMINAGDVVGPWGNTGTSSHGAHLHAQMRDASGQAVDYGNMMPGAGPVANITGGRYESMAQQAFNQAGDLFADTGADAAKQSALYGAAISALGTRAARQVSTAEFGGRAARLNMTSEAGYAAKSAMDFSNMAMLQSPDQYMSMLGRMNNAGAGAQDLNRTLTEAVAAGLDSSKNIEQMVNGVVELGMKTAGYGMQSTQGTSAIVAQMAAGGIAAGQDPTLAATAAIRAMDVLDKKTMGNDLSVGKMFIQQQAQKAGFSKVGTLALSTTGLSTMRSIKELWDQGDHEKAFKLAQGSQIDEMMARDSRGQLYLKKGPDGTTMLETGYRSVKGGAIAGGLFASEGRGTADKVLRNIMEGKGTGLVGASATAFDFQARVGENASGVDLRAAIDDQRLNTDKAQHKIEEGRKLITKGDSGTATAATVRAQDVQLKDALAGLENMKTIAANLGDMNAKLGDLVKSLKPSAAAKEAEKAGEQGSIKGLNESLTGFNASLIKAKAVADALSDVHIEIKGPNGQTTVLPNTVQNPKK